MRVGQALQIVKNECTGDECLARVHDDIILKKNAIMISQQTASPLVDGSNHHQHRNPTEAVLLTSVSDTCIAI